MHVILIHPFDMSRLVAVEGTSLYSMLKFINFVPNSLLSTFSLSLPKLLSNIFMSPHRTMSTHH